MIANLHPRQEERLAALRSYDILDTELEAEFDEVAQLASRICETPIAVINLIDADRQWFKAEVGLGVRSTPIETSLCAHVILEEDFVEIQDTLVDTRMCDNPLCLDNPGLRFYAGALLKTDNGLPLGTLCVLDHHPRSLTTLQRETLRVLAAQVMRHLELRVALKRQEVLRREIDHRVKNSLQTVGSIIRLQAARSGNKEVSTALDAVQTRLNAIIAFHDELHRSGNGTDIDLSALVKRLAVLQTAICPPGVDVISDLEPQQVTADIASSLGIIINEFVANAIKYAHAKGDGGTISISGVKTETGYRLIANDGGRGDLDTVAALNASKGLACA